jgi:hypothetical protein
MGLPVAWAFMWRPDGAYYEEVSSSAALKTNDAPAAGREASSMAMCQPGVADALC